ncbi:hypothetical protein [Solemya velesiana gill symbiont]|uniref:hypothetical protein n=1 Tax=Solemya velesiana gill symbiont TaxID=1918948 RepID=UPI001FE414D4|nr:hypothetical protein [Solemya velesiana gill symbiont]
MRAKPGSIHLRLLLAASLVLAAFLGLGAYALDRAFTESTETATRERLLGYVYALLAAADEDGRGRMRLPMALPDPRFSSPDSGLYARVVGTDDKFSWRSPSLVGRSSFDFLTPVVAGKKHFKLHKAGRSEFNVLNFGVAWVDDSGR